MAKAKSKTRIFSFMKYFGIFLIIAGLILNPFFVQAFFSHDRNIENKVYIFGVVVFEIVLISLGLLLFHKPRYYREVTLFFTSALLLFLVLEMSSRAYLCYFADYSMQSKLLFYGQCNMPSLYEPHPYMNYHGMPDYVSPDNLNMHNSYGFRGPEVIVPRPNSTYRIAALGGSTTYTVDVKDWKKDYPRQLEKELKEIYNYSNIEVVNAGLNSWNTHESLINFEFNVLDLQPDMIIIYDGINDVHSRLVNPSLYRGDNLGRRKQWTTPEIPFIFHSVFVRLITEINPMGLDQYVDAQTSAAGIFDSGFSSILNGTPMETLQKNKPIYFERNIRDMIAIARENNVSVMLATFAYSRNISDFAGAPHYQFALNEHNEVIKRIGQSHNLPVYDFDSEMPMNRTYSTDGRHVNEKGSELKGQLFAGYIFTNHLIDDKIRELRTLNIK